MVVGGLAVPGGLALHEGDPLALHGAGQQHGGTPPGGGGLPEGLGQGIQAVAVHGEHLPAKGPELVRQGATFITSQVGPSNWTPLSSTMAQTVSRAKWAAVMAASHTWPSWSSPSPSRQ